MTKLQILALKRNRLKRLENSNKNIGSGVARRLKCEIRNLEK